VWCVGSTQAFLIHRQSIAVLVTVQEVIHAIDAVAINVTVAVVIFAVALLQNAQLHIRIRVIAVAGD